MEAERQERRSELLKQFIASLTAVPLKMYFAGRYENRKCFEFSIIFLVYESFNYVGFDPQRLTKTSEMVSRSRAIESCKFSPIKLRECTNRRGR